MDTCKYTIAAPSDGSGYQIVNISKMGGDAMEDYVSQVVKKIAESARLDVASSLIDCVRIADENHIEREFVFEVFQREFSKEFSLRIE